MAGLKDYDDICVTLEDGTKKRCILLKNVDIRTVDQSILKDMSDVKIDTSLPIPERVAAFLEQIKNPYVFKVGDVAVKVSYKENGPTLQENFEAMLSSL